MQKGNIPNKLYLNHGALKTKNRAYFQKEAFCVLSNCETIT